MNLQKVSNQVEEKISQLFEELRSGMAEREDSRAFGAMIEKKITDHWPQICAEMGYSPLDKPGRRTIFDFAFSKGKTTVGIDVKTKDLERSDQRDIEYIRVAPFIMLPQNAYRIENLGTGQVRLNYTLNQVWDEIEWNRDIKSFYDLFVDLAITHYQRVSRDALKRIEALERFRQNGYQNFTFGKR